jgi:hypothetical protein
VPPVKLLTGGIFLLNDDFQNDSVESEKKQTGMETKK